MLTKAQNKQPKGQTGACQQCFECESCPSFQLLRSVPLFYPFPISFQQYPPVEHQWFLALFVAPLLGQHSARGLAACQPPISHLVQFYSPTLCLNLLLHSQPLLLLSMPRLLLHLDQLPIVLPLQFMLRFHPLPRQLVFIALQLSELVGVVAHPNMSANQTPLFIPMPKKGGHTQAHNHFRSPSIGPAVGSLEYKDIYDSSKVGVGTRQRFHFAFHSSHSRVHSNIDNKKESD